MNRMSVGRKLYDYWYFVLIISCDLCLGVTLSWFLFFTHFEFSRKLWPNDIFPKLICRKTKKLPRLQFMKWSTVYMVMIFSVWTTVWTDNRMPWMNLWQIVLLLREREKDPIRSGGQVIFCDWEIRKYQLLSLISSAFALCSPSSCNISEFCTFSLIYTLQHHRIG